MDDEYWQKQYCLWKDGLLAENETRKLASYLEQNPQWEFKIFMDSMDAAPESILEKSMWSDVQQKLSTRSLFPYKNYYIAAAVFFVVVWMYFVESRIQNLKKHNEQLQTQLQAFSLQNSDYLLELAFSAQEKGNWQKALRLFQKIEKMTNDEDLRDLVYYQQAFIAFSYQGNDEDCVKRLQQLDFTNYASSIYLLAQKIQRRTTNKNVRRASIELINKCEKILQNDTILISY
ncbi:hypothetical protein [Candidatus Uabimicrobium sp. HlEnr_7]|uniref:hypothetical protein n=1 Tax=Candidatus Uabimicrobium helgolandensis TaxID=3095367 RepID=UPI003559333B